MRVFLREPPPSEKDKDNRVPEMEEYPSTVYFHKQATAAGGDKLTLHVNKQGRELSREMLTPVVV